MNYYKTLGVSPSATPAEIKSAYRKLAKEHHPDRGGDENTFREISEAYSVLSDPHKRRSVNAGIDPNSNGPHYGFNANDFSDIFSRFSGARSYRKNKSVATHVSLTLEDVLTGKEIHAEVALPGAAAKDITINIPAGVEHGHQVKFSEMGDTSIPDLPAGDLIVHVHVLPHEVFERVADDLVYNHTLPVWDAILGTTISVRTLDQQALEVKIRPGTQSGTVLKCSEHGLPNIRTHRRGDLFIKLTVSIPTRLTKEQKEIVKQLEESFLPANDEESK